MIIIWFSKVIPACRQVESRIDFIAPLYVSLGHARFHIYRFLVKARTKYSSKRLFLLLAYKQS
jgi:hypothetical protein